MTFPLISDTVTPATLEPINIGRYVTGDGSDESAGFNAAADAARATGRGLFMPDGLTVRIDSTLNLRYIFDVDIRGTIRVSDTGMVVVGASRQKRDGAMIRIRKVVYVKSTQTNVALRTIGLKQANVWVGECPYWQWYATNTPADDESCSYCNAWPGRIGILELYCRDNLKDGTFGWITELNFFGGDIRLFRTDTDWHINEITFFKPCFERGEINIPVGNRIRFLGVRCEYGTKVYLGKDTSRCVIEDSFLGTYSSDRSGVQVVENKGIDNVITTSFSQYSQRRTLMSIDKNTTVLDGCAGVKGLRNLTPSIGGFTTVAAGATIFDTGKIQVKGGEGEFYARGWSMKRFQVFCSHKAIRVSVIAWSGDTQITDPSVLEASGNLTYNATAKRWQQGANVNEIAFGIRGETVTHVQIIISSGAADAVFEWLEISGYVDGTGTDFPVDAFKRNLQVGLAQENKPTKGRAPVGTRVGTPRKIWESVSLVDTKVTDTALGADRRSVTVSSVDGTAVGDVVGIRLDSGVAHWTTIAGFSDKTVQLVAPIPGNANVSVGNDVSIIRWV